MHILDKVKQAMEQGFVYEDRIKKNVNGYKIIEINLSHGVSIVQWDTK